MSHNPCSWNSVVKKLMRRIFLIREMCVYDRWPKWWSRIIPILFVLADTTKWPWNLRRFYEATGGVRLFFFLYKVGTSDLRLHRTVTHGTNHIVLAVKNFILLLMFFHESSVRNPTTSVTHDIFFNFLLVGVTYLIAVHKLKFTVKPCLNILWALNYSYATFLTRFPAHILNVILNQLFEGELLLTRLWTMSNSASRPKHLETSIVAYCWLCYVSIT